MPRRAPRTGVAPVLAIVAMLAATEALAFRPLSGGSLPDAEPRGVFAGAAEAVADPPGWSRAGGFWFGPGIDAPDPLAFAAAHPEIFGAGVELAARPPASAGVYTVVVLDQRAGGIAIEGARADLRYAGGKLVQVRSWLVADPGPVIDTRRLDAAGAEQAAGAALDALGLARAPAALDPEPVLVRAAGAWRVARRARVPDDGVTLWLDAADGTPLALRDEWRRGAATLDVRAWHEPRRAGDPPVLSPLASFEALQSDGQSFLADSAGLASLSFAGGGATEAIGLAGAYESVRLYTGTSARASVAVSDGIPASFTWDDPASRIAERDAYASHEVVRARMKTMAPDVAWLDTALRLIVDVPDGNGCNAYWDGTSVVFFAESAQCNSTARVADVVYHETGHGLHQHLSAGGHLAPDVGEGASDYLAATITGDPDIGPSFFKSSPNGLRRLDNALRWPEDVTGEPHHDGQMWGGSFWDLRSALIAELGTDDGIALADRLDADTLRLDPTLAGGFWDVLAADDDDGNLADGTPHDCAIVRAFGGHGLGPGDGLFATHDPLGEQSAARPGYPVRLHLSGTFLRCAGAALGPATLSWRLPGGAWTDVLMGDDLVPGWKAATIPAAPPGTRVEYRLAATDTLGREVALPVYGGDAEPFSFTVGDPRVLFSDDFESDRGWTHQLVDGDPVLGADDWERGVPAGLAGDPPAAFSGENVIGNDLGAPGFDGLYRPRVTNRMTSPPIDARSASGVHVSFRRWLNVEPGDRARVLVNGHEVWSNPPAETIRDRAWRWEDLDVSREADGRRIRVAFEIATNATNQQGGWTVDDVAVTATGSRDVPPACGCDLGGAPGATSTGGMLACVLLLVLRRRRRRPC